MNSVKASYRTFDQISKPSRNWWVKRTVAIAALLLIAGVPGMMLATSAHASTTTTNPAPESGEGVPGHRVGGGTRLVVE